MKVAPPLSGLTLGGRNVPRLFAVRAKDGTLLGTFTPDADVPRAARIALERALLEHAARTGVDVVEVRFRETLAWKKPRRLSG